MYQEVLKEKNILDMSMTRSEYAAYVAANNAKREERKSEPKTIWNFKLKEDGDEAIVRFAYESMDEVSVEWVHNGSEETRFKKIHCLNDYKNGNVGCPLCESGNKARPRVYLKLVEYVRGDDGSITPQARIWDRPVKFLDKLSSYYEEYGNCVYKIKRNGKKGDMQTDYEIMPANPNVYNPTLYPKDYSAFEGYELVGTNILNKTKMELEVMAREATGFANVAPTTPTYTNAPAYTNAPPTSDTLPFQEPSITLSSTPRRVQY